MRVMKDSGVEWIGEIPKDWEILPTKRFFSHTKTLAGDKVDTYERLALTMNGVIKRSKDDSEGLQPEKFDTYQVLKETELVFKLIDLANVKTSRVGLSPFTGIVSPAYIVLTNESDDNRFYYYFFISMYYNEIFNRLGDNGVRSSLNAQDLLSVPIVNISSDTQHRIADFLDDKCGKIDRYIEKQQQIIDKLKEYKQAVITEAVTKGLNPDVPMKDSGIEWIGMIPEHWGVAKLANLFTFLGGYAFNSDLYVSETENLIVRIGNVKNDRLLFDANPVYISDDLAEQVIKFKLQCGDILFTMTGTKGKRDYFYTLILDNFHIQTKNLYLNQRVGCFRKKAHIHAEYYNYLLKDNRILDSIFLYETGTANQGNLGIDSINRTKVHLPPYDEQIMIANYLKEKCSRIDAVIAKKEVAINKSTEYKKSLIYEAVTGKLEV